MVNGGRKSFRGYFLYQGRGRDGVICIDKFVADGLELKENQCVKIKPRERISLTPKPA
ncbi:MAG: hypothetical protein ABH950_05395 [Candidatus Altiarchaeota archaeon]